MSLAGLDKRMVLAGLIFVLLAAVNLASSRFPAGANGPFAQEATELRTPMPTEPHVTEQPESMTMATPTATPLPAELLGNYQQTTGIIIVAGMLVLIVAAGVFNQLISERQSKQ